jgi:hypothetical protein
MHSKQPQDGNGCVSRLLASLPLIHAGYPFINVRKHKWEEYTSGSTGLYHVKPLRPIVYDDGNRP